MNIDYLMEDVKKLCTNVCQEYLRFVLFSDWKDKLEAKKDKLLSNPYTRESYIEAYETIDKIGIKNYSIENMDITLINAIFHDYDFCFTNKEMRLAMEDVNSDRNKKSHENYHESAKDQFKKAMRSLVNIRRLINKTYKFDINNKNIILEKEAFENFKNKYNYKVDKLENRVIDEFVLQIGYGDLIDEKIKYCLDVDVPNAINKRFEGVYDALWFLANFTHPEVLRELYRKGTIAEIPDAYWRYVEEELGPNYDPDDSEMNNDISSTIIKILNSNFDKKLGVSLAYDYFKKRGVKHINEDQDLINELRNKGHIVEVHDNKIFIDKNDINSI